MRARHGPKFLRAHDADEAHEVLHGVLVSSARVCVCQVGEPFDLGRHIGQPMKLGSRQHPRSTGGGNLGQNLIGVAGFHGACVTLDNICYQE
jgi:hypothetical protein